jgi:integrase
VASFLASVGIALDGAAHKLFTDAVSDLLFGAFHVLEKRANNDYSPDEIPQRFPAFVDATAKPVDGLSCWALFEAWVTAAKRKDATVRRWRGVFLEMQAKFPHTSVPALTAKDAKAWIEGLITEKRTAYTVGNVWLPVSKGVFNWGVEQELLTTNPFSAIKVTKQKRARERSGKTFTTEEAAIILGACQRMTVLKTPMDRAKRWVPLLCAYTGARAGEMTQLRKQDVQKRGDVYFAHLTPRGRIDQGR